MAALRHFAVAVVIGIVAAPAWVMAQGAIFRWVDAHGNLHLSDELGDVPEPYYGMYRAQLANQQATVRSPSQPAQSTKAAVVSKAGKATDAMKTTGRATIAVSEPEVPPPLSPSAQEEQRRATWKALVAHWRTELGAATEAFAQADQHLGELTQNAMLARTPQVQAEIAEATQARDQARTRLEVARRMLTDELPARAKKELVPPAWLM